MDKGLYKLYSEIGLLTEARLSNHEIEEIVLSYELKEINYFNCIADLTLLNIAHKMINIEILSQDDFDLNAILYDKKSNQFLLVCDKSDGYYSIFNPFQNNRYRSIYEDLKAHLET